MNKYYIKFREKTQYFSILMILFFIIFIFVIPLIILLILSFTGSSFGSAYLYIFNNSNIFLVFWRSIWVSVIVVLFCLVFGYFIAYTMYRIDSKFGLKICLMFFVLPLLLNSLIKIIALKLILIPLHLVGTSLALIIGLIYMYIPYMIISIYFVLATIDKNIINSSYDLGATRRQTFFKIILPLSSAGVLSGIFLVFFSSLTTVIVSAYLGGKEKMIGNIIINYFTNSGDNISTMIAITIIIFIIILGFVFIVRTMFFRQTRKKMKQINYEKK